MSREQKRMFAIPKQMVLILTDGEAGNRNLTVDILQRRKVHVDTNSENAEFARCIFFISSARGPFS